MKIGEFIRTRQAEGLVDKDILPLVLQKFPQARTTLNSIRWYRSKDKTTLQDKTRAVDYRTEGKSSRDRQTLLPINPGRIGFSVLKKHGIEGLDGFKQADRKAEDLRKHLDEPATQQKIRERHVLGATSTSIQEIILVV
jgi:hypothetical protein